VLTIFPEGTTSDGESLLPFKSSLLSAAESLPEGTVIQPVLPAYEEARDSAWTGGEHGVANFLQIAARVRPIRLTLWFLPPLAGAECENRKAIAGAAQRSIEAALHAAHGLA